MRDKIVRLHAHEILDSRGEPTVSVTVELGGGARGQASVPSGASTGMHEAIELRDGDKKRYGGKGVLKAVANVNNRLSKILVGQSVKDLRRIDDLMRIADGSNNKRHLGANAILAVSIACARAGAKWARMPLYEWLRETYGLDFSGFRLPIPFLNVVNGGRHADNDLDIQEFMIVPVIKGKFAEKLRAGSEVFHALQEILYKDDFSTGVGNEGGFAPDLGTPEKVFAYLEKAIKKAGYKLEKEVALAIDVAASEWYKAQTNVYSLPKRGVSFSAGQLINRYQDWLEKYPIISIEDGLAEDDWDNWKKLTAKIGKKIMLVGDDLFVTNSARLERGIISNVANSILIKPNQIGTISETIDTILLAQENDYTIVISHRSGETDDSLIADLAVAVNAEYIKSGAPSRYERLAKYNRLLEIEEELMG